MLKPGELRRGMFVAQAPIDKGDKPVWGEITEIRKHFVHMHLLKNAEEITCPHEHLEGIPLTLDVAKCASFKEWGKDAIVALKEPLITFVYTDQGYYSGLLRLFLEKGIYLKNLHELQDCWYFFTGEQLPIDTHQLKKIQDA